MRHDSEGFVFAYVIRRDWFQLTLFRLIPLVRIRLRDIRYIRARSGDSFIGLISEVVSARGRCVYWPHPFFILSSTHNFAYVIGLESGKRVFVRLGTGFHYKLRAAMGRARISQ